MTDYSNMQDEPLFDHDAIEWTYIFRDGLVTLYSNKKLCRDEALHYVNHGREAFRNLRTIYALVDGCDVLIEYCYGHQNFERIRRITGYLVGTLDRFNDGKRAEESERVKHKL